MSPKGYDIGEGRKEMLRFPRMRPARVDRMEILLSFSQVA